jgi:hypothetical protein
MPSRAGNRLGERFLSFGLVFFAVVRRIKELHGSSEPSERCQSGLSSGLGKAV